MQKRWLRVRLKKSPTTWYKYHMQEFDCLTRHCCANEKHDSKFFVLDFITFSICYTLHRNGLIFHFIFNMYIYGIGITVLILFDSTKKWCDIWGQRQPYDHMYIAIVYRFLSMPMLCYILKIFPTNIKHCTKWINKTKQYTYTYIYLIFYGWRTTPISQHIFDNVRAKPEVL